MKNYKMNQWVGLGVATLAITASLTTQQAWADKERITNDIFGMTTKLLGHEPQVMNALEADKQGLSRGYSKHQPWSGSFWPDIIGNIANHYRDHGTFWSKIRFGMRYDLARNRVHRMHNRVAENFSEWDVDTIAEKLSPSEKYDLLVGDLDFSLTRAVLEELDFRDDHRMSSRYRSGEVSEDDVDGSTGATPTEALSVEEKSNQILSDDVQYRFWKEKGGSLPWWSGICDGWAPASIYLPRPTNTVTVTGAKGHIIKFFPDDLKALGSYLFARSQTPYYASMPYFLAGNACRSKKGLDRKDDGTIDDPRCNDVDAGMFHATLINRIGKDKLGFIADFDNNLKVNNHPVAGYELEYFHPGTGKTGPLKASMAPLQDSGDIFLDVKGRRHPNAKFIVGVRARVHQMFYVWAEEFRKTTKDSESNDIVKIKEYVYDLELDEKGNILGGEWGDRSGEGERVGFDKNDQPDFIWMAGIGNLPKSEMSFNAYMGTTRDFSNPRPFGNTDWAWDGKSPMPADWIMAAREDVKWAPPVVAENPNEVAVDARNSKLKSAQVLSHIVYFLFDKSRMSHQY